MNGSPNGRSADSVGEGPDRRPWQRGDLIGKRLLDLVVASVVLALAGPVLVLVALAIVIESPGPVFYRAERVGRGGRRLRMLKFRKMSPSAAGAPLTAHDDERFTRMGAMLARTRLDELPQLWHVLRGDMSLVGPRPEDPSFVAHRRADYADILRARPGIAGLSQLAFADESRILDAENPLDDYLVRILPQKCHLDRLYLRRRTVAMDLRILRWTLIAVLLRRPVAVHRSTGAISVRVRAEGSRTRLPLSGGMSEADGQSALTGPR